MQFQNSYQNSMYTAVIVWSVVSFEVYFASDRQMCLIMYLLHFRWM